MLPFRYFLLFAVLCTIYIGKPATATSPPIAPCPYGDFKVFGLNNRYCYSGKYGYCGTLKSRCAYPLTCYNYKCYCPYVYCYYGIYYGGKFNCPKCCPYYPPFCHRWVTDPRGCWRCQWW